MIKNIMTTTAALALMAGMASAQGLAAESEVTDIDGHQTTVGAEASAAGTEIIDTAQAIGDATGDALENAGAATADALSNTGKAAGDIAREGYSSASDAAAQIDAALTADAVVKSNTGETLGTVESVDPRTGAVVIDLDGEMEASLDTPTERIALPASAFEISDDGVMIPLSGADLAAAVNLHMKTTSTN
ncbi:hypothetical protein LCGC14_0228780 [marine sediment metagenome]|uniref:Uncharacterized protein n=1 Tax=marine sediment metagenome TaxID=412755 RepID=A0A0F9UFS3_9ZZZZ